MARKRSLKDAAADRLVEKNKIVPAAPVAPKKRPAAERSVVKAPQVAPAAESAGGQTPLTEPSKAPEDKEKSRPCLGQTPLAEPSKAPEDKEKSRPCLMWIAISVLIGFAGGYFFGMGQAMGSANVSYLLIGSIGGYVLGRFIKVI
jgi:hypothetical protein